VLQSSDLPNPDCDPFPLEIMGDKFVAFRNTDGVVGDSRRIVSPPAGLARHRALRGQRHPLPVPRLEVRGRRSSVETPNVPDPEFKTRFRAKAYPVREAGGLLWAYFGPAELQPDFPRHPWFDVPDSHRILRGRQLQLRAGIRGAGRFLAFEHLAPDGLRASQKLENLNFAAAAQMAFDAGPRIEVDDTDFGFQLRRPARWRENRARTRMSE